MRETTCFVRYAVCSNDDVRSACIGASLVEIQGVITDASTPVPRLKVKAKALKVRAVKSKRERLKLPHRR